MSVGNAIIAYLTQGQKARSITELVRELEAGHCVFGAIKPAREIVSKTVIGYIQSGRLVWVDKTKMVVDLADRKKRKA